MVKLRDFTKLPLLAAMAYLLFVALFLRLFWLNHYPPGLSPDAAFNGLDADQILSQRKPAVFLASPWGKEGLIANLIALSFLTFGRSAWSIKLVSGLYGTLGVAGTFLLGRILRSFRVGWWAAFFLAGSFWHLYLSRAGIRPVMMSAHLTWSLFWLINAAQRRSPRQSILAGLVFGLGFYSYAPFRVTLALGLLVLWWFNPRQSVRIGFLTSFGVTVLPLLAVMATQPALYFERTRMIVVLPKTASGWLTNLKISADLFLPGRTQAQTYGIYQQSLVWWPVSLLAGLGLLSGFWSRQTRRLACLLGAWLILGILVSAVTNEPPSLTRTEFALPAFYLLAALGLEQILTASSGKAPLQAEMDPADSAGKPRVSAWRGRRLRPGLGVMVCLGLLLLPLVSWSRLVRISGTVRTQEMFAVRLVKAAGVIQRSHHSAPVYLAKVAVPGGYASHFSDGVIEFLLHRDRVSSIAPPDITAETLTKPVFVIATVPKGRTLSEFSLNYPNSYPLMRTVAGFLGTTEVYFIQ